MATPKSVWGIDVGQCALKALKLRNVEGQLQVEAFDIIEHPKILSQPDADRKQLIRLAMEQFLAQNNVTDDALFISVPGQASFTRFVKLPPVSDSKIPDMAKFEAQQQIPFPIEDVVWRWQTFKSPDSPDVELGIFAMKRVDVDDMLSNFADVEMGVDGVQMAPLSLYNFMIGDAQQAEDGATLLADVGADKTDLVVADGPRVWTRTIQIGGNNFTEALMRAFKLPFPKAEKLKRTAATSKYARQIFQAMRPVFADLVQEIQRSIGFYTSVHRDSRFKKLIGLGNGFRLPGLQKFLEQNLNIPVARVDNYNKLLTSAAVNAPAFTEQVLSFAVAYGLAVQGLGQATVTTNLLPEEVASRRSWGRKKPWFVGAAAMIVAMMGLYVYRSYADAGSMSAGAIASAQSTLVGFEKLQSEYNTLVGQGQPEKDQIAMCLKLNGYHAVWPDIEAAISEAILSKFPDQTEFDKLGAIADPGTFKKALESGIATKPRDKRQLLHITSFKSVYEPNVDVAANPQSLAVAPGAAGQPVQVRGGYRIVIEARTPLGDSDTAQALQRFTQNDLRTAIAKYDILALVGTPKYQLTGIAVTAAPALAVAPAVGTFAVSDRLFPTETVKDTSFTLTLYVAVTGDGVKLPEGLISKP